MTKFKAVIFDAGGVLHESNNAMADDLLEELGVTTEMLRRIRTKQMPLLGCGAIDETEFWRQVTTEYGLRAVMADENLLGRAFTQAIIEHVPITALIKELRNKGVKLAVLSNTIQPHALALKEAGIYDGFDHVFLSYEVGISKPDPAIYQYALKVLDVGPEETIFVDDDRNNVEAAEALGIVGIIYSDSDKVVNDIRSLIFSE